MNPKLLTFLALTSLTLIGLYSITPLTADPENIKNCEETTYKLARQSFKIDGGIVPGKNAKLSASFLPDEDGQISKMEIQVFKGGYKLYSQDVKQSMDFSDGEEFEYDYVTRLPGFIPHLFIQMKLVFYGEGSDVLNCVAFDLNL